MTPSEYRARTIHLEKQIDFNKRIKCPLVAARYERQLAALRKEYDEILVHPLPSSVIQSGK